MPRFIGKFLTVIEIQGENDLGKKAGDLLSRFLDDLKEASSRSMQLDRDVIIKLQEFLDKCDEAKRISLQTCFVWLEQFIYFFKQDCDALRSSQEESKDSSQVVVDPSNQNILRQMYKDHIPDLISTIIKLRNS